MGRHSMRSRCTESAPNQLAPAQDIRKGGVPSLRGSANIWRALCLELGLREGVLLPPEAPTLLWPTSVARAFRSIAGLVPPSCRATPLASTSGNGWRFGGFLGAPGSPAGMRATEHRTALSAMHRSDSSPASASLESPGPGQCRRRPSGSCSSHQFPLRFRLPRSDLLDLRLSP